MRNRFYASFRIAANTKRTPQLTRKVKNCNAPQNKINSAINWQKSYRLEWYLIIWHYLNLYVNCISFIAKHFLLWKLTGAKSNFESMCLQERNLSIKVKIPRSLTFLQGKMYRRNEVITKQRLSLTSFCWKKLCIVPLDVHCACILLVPQISWNSQLKCPSMTEIMQLGGNCNLSELFFKSIKGAWLCWKLFDQNQIWNCPRVYSCNTSLYQNSIPECPCVMKIMSRNCK